MKENEPVAWHPSFAAALQLELEEYAAYLQYMLEFPLTTEPLKVDVIVRKSDGIPIAKQIGRMFRQHNIIEYKSPQDYVSVNDLYKSLAYVYLYKDVTDRQDGQGSVDIGELTLTLVCLNMPAKLLKHLQERQVDMIRPYPGVYYIQGMDIPVQLIVQSELSPAENAYVALLSNRLEEKQQLLEMLNRYFHSSKDGRMRLVLHAVFQANPKLFTEVLRMSKLHLDREGEKYFEELVQEWELDVKWEQRGYEKGMEKGMEKGIEKGMEKGIEKGMEKGFEKGIKESVMNLLQEYGAVPDDVRRRIDGEKDVEQLNRWLKLAATASSMEEFRNRLST